MNVRDGGRESAAVICASRWRRVAVSTRQVRISCFVQKPLSYAVARRDAIAVAPYFLSGGMRHGPGVGCTTAREDEDVYKKRHSELTIYGDLGLQG